MNELRKLLSGILKGLIPESAVLPILWGPLRGARWIPRSGILEYWLGIYEHKTQKLFKRFIKEGYVVYDVGAHVGFYALLSEKYVGKNGRVFAFEPFPKNASFLKEHMRLNKCRNVEVVQAAVSDREGFVFFTKDKDSFQGHIVSGGGVRVFSVTLDNMVFQKKINPPDVLKIDVEGGEYAVLRGGSRVLKKYKPHIFLATHGEKLEHMCVALLKRKGYKIERIGSYEFVAKVV